MQLGQTDCAAPAATSRTWNSPTSLYLARRLHDIAGGRPISVMDMGCGDGAAIELLLSYGYDMHGYDFPDREAKLRARLEGHYGGDFASHIKVTSDERRIPFPDASFDVVYANQVFEHVRFLDQMVSECARVLKPSGVLLVNFPMASHPIECHLKIPFAHWVPPGRVRIGYLRMFYALRLRPRLCGESALEAALRWDDYLTEKTYYRFMNEIRSVFQGRFASVELETSDFIAAKLDMLSESGNPRHRVLARILRPLCGKVAGSLVTYLMNACFCARQPLNGESTAG
ncbi:MAG TPA: class I SAM-dependent methyltransferase [Armatimonadota bacterium]|jgi:SAM-dependent methyltransferase